MSANTSLPAPFGPVMSTGTSAWAICVAVDTRVCIASLSYTMPHRSNWPANVSRAGAVGLAMRAPRPGRVEGPTDFEPRQQAGRRPTAFAM